MSDRHLCAQGTHCEHTAVHIDDLLMASESSEAIVMELTNTHKFKLKGTGKVTFHLGLGHEHDDNGHLCLSPQRCIKRMLDAHVDFFGTKPEQVHTSPLEKGDNPKLDTSEELDAHDWNKEVPVHDWCFTVVHQSGET